MQRRIFTSMCLVSSGCMAVYAAANKPPKHSQYALCEVKKANTNSNNGTIMPNIQKIEEEAKEYEVKDDDDIIANGYVIDPRENPTNLPKEKRAKFALKSDPEHCDLMDRAHFKPKVLVAGAAGSTPAVWTMSGLLTPNECSEWIARAESIGFDDSDFIFKTGKNGFSRMSTGGRRNSATMLVEDLGFAKQMAERVRSQVPPTLHDGRKFIGLRHMFLVSRYREGGYFAPHFDGAMLWDDPVTAQKSQSAFTVVLYLSDDFEGGATHYLPGQGSEVDVHRAVQPPKGSAAVHRALTVQHAAGQVERGTKYVMQFGLMYEQQPDPSIGPLRWAA